MTPRSQPRADAVRSTGSALPALGLAAALTAALLTGPAVTGPAVTGQAPPSGSVLLAPAADRAPVTPHVEEVDVRGASPDGLAEDGATAGRNGRSLAALSAAEDVDGYAVAGATWKTGTAPEDIVVEVRTLTEGEWSQWEEVEVHDDHGPDPDSAEAKGARDGSDAVVLGEVEEVQTRVTSADGAAPEDLELAVVESDPVRADEPTAASGTGTVDGDLSAVATAPRPTILSRAQWGANESLRSGSPSYAEVNAGFVHHTVNANGYTAAQVPGIIRGIYAYHTQSRGWSDVGYNFLVDRFGRIWEGRYGGVHRAVVGAHTSGYNDDAFAMSAIGNFETAQPSSKMLNAYGRLMGWKLALHGVGAKQTRNLDGRRFAAISGHRDAGQTACPGRYLYGRLGAIRTKAQAHQDSATPPAPPVSGPPHDLTGTAAPDLVVRDRRSGAIKVRAGNGVPGFGRQRATSRAQAGSDLVVASADLTGDRLPDLVVRHARTKYGRVLPGKRGGDFGRPGPRLTAFRNADLLTAVGDLDGDGRNDMVSRNSISGHIYLHRSHRVGRFRAPKLLLRKRGWWRWMAGVGDVNGDKVPDLVMVDAKGRLRLHAGTRRGRLRTPATTLATGWAGKDLVSGGVNFGVGGRVDLIARERKTGRVWMYLLRRNGSVYARTGDWAGMGNLNRLSAVPDLTGDRMPDLVGRRRNGRIVVLAGHRTTWLRSPVATGASSTAANLLMSAGDWNTDGHEDVLVRPRSGRMQVWKGNGAGRLRLHPAQWRGWQLMRHVVPVGDVTGDGRADLMAQDRERRMWLYPGTGAARPDQRRLARATMMNTDLATAAGPWDANATRDLIVRNASNGALYLYPVAASGRLQAPRKLGSGYGRYDRIIGRGDIDGDGHPDLIGRERSTGFLWLLPGTPTGLRPRQFMAGAAPHLDLIG